MKKITFVSNIFFIVHADMLVTLVLKYYCEFYFLDEALEDLKSQKKKIVSFYINMFLEILSLITFTWLQIFLKDM